MVPKLVGCIILRQIPLHELQVGGTDYNKLGFAASLVQELRSYGISEGQAKLYIFLLGKEPTNVRTILSELRLHRVDAYRKLRELEGLGLVQVHLGSPMTFSAVAPTLALDGLIQRLNSQVLKLKQSARGLEQRLIEYTQANNFSASQTNDKVSDRQMYRLVVGRESYYSEMHTAFRNARVEILRIISASGMKRSFILGFYEDYLKAKLQGARIRIISEVNNFSHAEARKLSKLAEVRHMDNINLRFSVVDRQRTIFGRLADNDEKARTEADSCLISDDTKFAEASRFFFEHLWEKSSSPNFDQFSCKSRNKQSL